MAATELDLIVSIDDKPKWRGRIADRFFSRHRNNIRYYLGRSDAEKRVPTDRTLDDILPPFEELAEAVRTDIQRAICFVIDVILVDSDHELAKRKEFTKLLSVKMGAKYLRANPAANLLFITSVKDVVEALGDTASQELARSCNAGPEQVGFLNRLPENIPSDERYRTKYKALTARGLEIVAEVNNRLDIRAKVRMPEADLRRHRLSDSLFELPDYASLIQQMVVCARFPHFPVLIQGPSGSGKELVARRVHLLSDPGNKPFVALNITALSGALIESELFGVVPGAFTHAVDRGGLLKTATGGTFLLDEIGDLDLALQVKILRVLDWDAPEYFPVGSDEPVPFTGRFMAATWRDLDQMVTERQFRQDLLSRLDMFRITVPSVHDAGAALELFRLFWKLDADKTQAQSEDLENLINERKFGEAMLAREWPGNLRSVRAFANRCAVYRWQPEQASKFLTPPYR